MKVMTKILKKQYFVPTVQKENGKFDKKLTEAEIRKQEIAYVNRNGKPWYKQRQTKKLIKTVAKLMLGESKRK